ncbi:MAG TPA: DUF6516 family protein [Gammaproteobacteria bacterium]|nr:DUF6516 family protein [Gammaproteobacteria bacterium]
MNQDESIDNLLDLHDVRYVIDEKLGLWVKFEIKKIEPNKDRPHGIKYSFTLHDRTNKRIMGFDNAHVIEYGGKNNVAPKKTYDHWHRDGNDEGRPYQYVNAGKLLTDFWAEVDKKTKEIKGDLA